MARTEAEKDDEHVINLTALIMNKKGDRILIVKRGDREIAYPGKWAFPSCKVYKKDTIMAALEKGVPDSVGLKIENRKKFITDYTFTRYDGKNIIGLCFLVKAKSENIKLKKDLVDFRWITAKELKNYDHIDGMDEEIKIAFEK